MDETHNLDMVFTNPGGAIDGKKLHQLEWLKHWSVDGWTCFLNAHWSIVHLSTTAT